MNLSYEDKSEDLIDCKEQLLDKHNSLKELNEKIESLITSEEIEKEVSGSELIPEDISLEYNRKRKANSEFDIPELVNFIKTEVECRENSNLLHTPNNYSQEGYKRPFNRNIPTATTLNTSIKSCCLFCKSEP
ncbi:hypothetical protein TNCV_2567141 [Trichonephila clavipes]|uniref:Uncharacterized protein n=1 Tax=Trichonephila clavipes TaxID=2585209 RepID=A0A8X7BNG4_TRICX|nr:hypothetical protein TNCV_2567141 [Trichonephila clavipes]